LLLDDPAAAKMGHSSPHFSFHVCCGQMAVWIKVPLGREVNVGPGDIVLGGDSAARPNGHSLPPNFRPMSVVAKWLEWIQWGN